jgi:hypothetical protein
VTGIELTGDARVAALRLLLRRYEQRPTAIERLMTEHGIELKPRYADAAKKAAGIRAELKSLGVEA